MIDRQPAAAHDDVLREFARGTAGDAVRRAYELGRKAATEATATELQQVCHDLRTPLNSILGFGQLLELDDLDPEQRDAVAQILRAGHQLLDMVNSLVTDHREDGRADADVTVDAGRPTQLDEQPTQRTFTVVCIDDNVANVRLIERVLALRANLVLVPAFRGDEGVRVVGEHLPDLVLLDLHLPDMHGVEVLRALKGDPRTATIPVAVVTADSTPGQIQPLAGEGARFHLTKPLDIDLLLSIIDDVADEKGQGPER
jgi:CheY-like chemotaxis protein